MSTRDSYRRLPPSSESKLAMKLSNRRMLRYLLGKFCSRIPTEAYWLKNSEYRYRSSRWAVLSESTPPPSWVRPARGIEILVWPADQNPLASISQPSSYGDRSVAGRVRLHL